MLYTVIIAPIETIVEWVFLFISNKFSSLNVIYSVIGVSLVINFLALPLYNIADNLQEKERKISRSLEYRVKRIKKAFKGDEQFMILSEYYRQNNYHPLYVLRSSLSILIEIPFFIAAYHYLSNCEKLMGATFWIFKDLGSPDNLITFALAGKTIVINILPILMTLINFVSGAIYCKDAPVREKLQLYGIAIVFLALLYNSPSGLVIYWILNNLFSLGKNIVMKMKKPGRVLHIILTICVFVLVLMFWKLKSSTDIWKKIFMTVLAVVFAFIPLIWNLYKKTSLSVKINDSMNKADAKQNFILFLTASIALWLLYGYLLPASVVSSSPIEFSFIGKTESPLSYIYSTLTFFLGFFVLWPVVIYKMFGKKVKSVLPILFFVILICSLFNVYVFKPEYGTIDNQFLLDNKNVLIQVSNWFYLLPFIIAFIILGIYLLIIKHKKLYLFSMLAISIFIAEFGLGIQKINSIKTDYKNYVANINKNENLESHDNFETVYHLSKTKENVLVLFLDRAIGSFIPNIFEQFPEFEKEFTGFTYYPNTLSSGAKTINGFPPIVGGYEYTVEENYKRKDKLLVEKHNEALLVMPKLFMDAGYDVTYTDPSLTNYVWSGDLSIFEDYPQMKVSEQIGKYTKKFMKEKNVQVTVNPDKNTIKQIRNFSVLQSLYPFFRSIFYNTVATSSMNTDKYLQNFANLYYLPEITDFDNDKKTFTLIENETTHRPILLEYPEYEIPIVSSKPKDTAGTYNYYSEDDLMDYNVNVASIRQISKYLKYLKDNNVYDNTRIIIVSDHGYSLPYRKFENFENPVQPSQYNCLFMVKDFNCNEPLKTDMTFMTNADTLFYAKEGLNVSNINPFTGNELIQKKDYLICAPITGAQWNVKNMRNKTQLNYSKAKCWKVHDNIFEPSNWEPYKFEEK